jgi:hypothetical protein
MKVNVHNIFRLDLAYDTDRKGTVCSRLLANFLRLYFCLINFNRYGITRVTSANNTIISANKSQECELVIAILSVQHISHS